MQIKDAFAFAFAPPPLPELGTRQGLRLQPEGRRRASATRRSIAARNQFLGAATQDKLLANVRPNGQDDAPQFRIDVDNRQGRGARASRSTTSTRRSPPPGAASTSTTSSTAAASSASTCSPTRRTAWSPEDFSRWTVRNAKGEMVPFSAFASWRWDYGPPRLERYNGASSLEINGEAAPGVSSGTAMAEVERLVVAAAARASASNGPASPTRSARPGRRRRCSTRCRCWSSSCASRRMYESWAIPTAVMLVVPLGILGAVLATTLRGMERDVYFQVAMLTTVGLSSKNAILIIAFAKDNLAQGHGPASRPRCSAVRDPPAADPDDLARVRPRRAAARASRPARARARSARSAPACSAA